MITTRQKQQLRKIAKDCVKQGDQDAGEELFFSILIEEHVKVYTEDNNTTALSFLMERFDAARIRAGVVSLMPHIKREPSKLYPKA